MHITVERTDLSAAMSRIANIVDRKQTIPILSNVLLTADDDTLSIRGTNLDMEAIEVIPANVTEPGVVTVPADMLNELARNLPQGAQIQMKQNETRLAVSSGRTRVNMPTLPANSFPPIWETPGDQTFEIDGDALAYMVGRVSNAQCQDEARSYLKGVRAISHEGRLRFVATNFNMLAYVDGADCPEFAAVTIPTRMVSEMSRITGRVEVGVSENLISLKSGRSSITSKLIDKSLGFPEYTRVIPASSPNGAVLASADLSAAIHRASISRDTLAKDPSIRLTFSPGALSVSAKSDISDALDEISINYDGPEIALKLNPKYILDMLTALNCETACVGFGDSKTATVWQAAGDDSGKSVLMPQKGS